MDRSCEETQMCVRLTLKKTCKDHIQSQRWKEEKRRLASCLQRLFYHKERKKNPKKKKEQCAVQPNKISFRTVAHCGLIEEALSGHCYDRFRLGFSSQLFFYTHTRRFRFHV
ncbi:hypothetical protein F2P81_016079 [Scophthalmus maximus]|uniref:Uncharacterized protein n=1 Tax=Scophthalmus maximus TaxID=52904 RepID=A0A6A4SKI1_SCOMX|nr:hypothetical protein F2P81_016079 [Scophthalmus maximus]